jgi:hypothetical protein
MKILKLLQLCIRYPRKKISQIENSGIYARNSTEIYGMRLVNVNTYVLWNRELIEAMFIPILINAS